MTDKRTNTPKPRPVPADVSVNRSGNNGPAPTKPTKPNGR